MRHVFLTGAIATSPGGVVKTAWAGRLVPLSGSTQRVATGDLRAALQAIALTPVTAAAQKDLTAA